MRHLQETKYIKTAVTVVASALLTAGLAMSVEPNTRTFTAGQKDKVQGVILSRDGNSLKIRGDDDSIGTVDLTNDTKIQLKKGVFGHKTDMKVDSLVAGLHVEVQGKGSDKGDLVADKVIFDPNSMRASRQVDARVAPVEARTGSLEGRAGQLESRAGQLETREGQLEDTEKQTQQQVGQVKDQVGQVKTEADQANQGVDNVNQRVSNLDNYQEKYSEVVYFRVNSSKLTPEDKQKLDNLAQQAKNEKGYAVEVAGYADKTGPVALNQQLSEARANAVIQYLEQQGDIPIHRILTPAGMGTTHEAADNKTSSGRKLNRRVEVKVLVNQGVVAGSTQPAGNGSAPKPPSDTSK
jgi:outer membrane protein OmpA-like peptidoglycan-associated protein